MVLPGIDLILEVGMENRVMWARVKVPDPLPRDGGGMKEEAGLIFIMALYVYPGQINVVCQVGMDWAPIVIFERTLFKNGSYTRHRACK